MIHHTFDHRLDIRLAGNIRDEDFTISVNILDFFSKDLSLFGIDIYNSNNRPFPGESQSGSLANSCRCSCDYTDLTLKAHFYLHNKSPVHANDPGYYQNEHYV